MLEDAMRYLGLTAQVIFPVLLLSACQGVNTQPSESTTVAQFNPAPVSPHEENLVLPAVPQPSNLLLDPGSGRVALPTEVELQILGRDEPVVVDSFSTTVAKQLVESYLNTLYGFTLDTLTETSFLGAEVDDTTLTPESVYVLDITPLLAATPDIPVERVPASIVTGDFESEKGVTPLGIGVPPGNLWTQGHTYAVVLTNAITDVDGAPVVSSYVFNLLKSTIPLAEEGRSVCALPDETAAQLEELRAGMMAPIFDYLESDAAGEERLLRSEIVSLWTFTVRPGSMAINDPTQSLFPTPNDLVFFSPASSLHDCDGDGSPDCTEGHLCFPIACEDDTPAQRAFFEYMNSLTGWPAATAISASFSLPLDKSAVTTDSVSLYQLTDEGVENLGLEVVADEPGTTLTLSPTGGVAAGESYAAVITTGLRTAKGDYEVRPSTVTAISKLTEPVSDESGKSLLTDFAVADADSVLLEGIRQGIDDLIKKVGLDESRANIAAIWNFTVQSHNEALYDPTAGLLPFPNDVLMELDDKGNPVRVNLPVDDAAPEAEKALVAQLNLLDGFSPVAGTSTRFLRPLDESTFDMLDAMTDIMGTGLGDKISLGLADVSDVDVSAGVAGMTALMQDGAIYDDTKVRVSFDNGTLSIRPAPGKPMRPGRQYMALVFDNLKSAEKGEDGNPYPIEVSPVFFMARSPHPLHDEDTGKSNLITLADSDAEMLEELRLQYNMIFEPLESPVVGVPRDRVLMFWTFTTQTVGEWLLAVKKDLVTLSIGNGQGTLQSPADAGIDLPHADKVLLNGSFTAYTALEEPATETDPPSTGRMLFDDKGMPDWSKGELPFTFLLPKEEGGVTAPFPIVILQHGLGSSREVTLSQAEAFLEAGYAVIAIDMVLHGDRAPEGVPDGWGFFSADAAASRDHIIHTALDIVQLATFITKGNGGLVQWLTTETGNSNTVDTKKVYFVGSSLGAMAGFLAHTVVEEMDTAAFVAPAGHLVRVLEESQDQEFKQPIFDALAAMGFEPGTQEYQQFMDLAQTILDRADPLNYAAHLVRSPFDETSPRKSLILTAQKDTMLPKATSMELACAAQSGVYPYFKEYEGMCHGFFFENCGNGESLEAGAHEAAQDVLDFFAASGSGAGIDGVLDGESLNCENL